MKSKLLIWLIVIFVPLGGILIALFYRPTREKLKTFLAKFRSGAIASFKPVKSDLKAAFVKVAKRYGVEYARRVEQLFRLETAHFSSGQWKSTNTPGMVAQNDVFPFGWSSLKEWADGKGYRPVDFSTEYYGVTSDGKSRTYIKFPNGAEAVDFVSWFLKEKRSGAVEKWYSLLPDEYIDYSAKLVGIKTKYV